MHSALLMSSPDITGPAHLALSFVYGVLPGVYSNRCRIFPADLMALWPLTQQSVSQFTVILQYFDAWNIAGQVWTETPSVPQITYSNIIFYIKYLAYKAYRMAWALCVRWGIHPQCAIGAYHGNTTKGNEWSPGLHDVWVEPPFPRRFVAASS